MDKVLMFLTTEEICRLTGRKKSKDQIAILAQKGYSFDADFKGRPIVLRSAVEERLGIKATKPKVYELNIAGLREMANGQKKKNE